MHLHWNLQILRTCTGEEVAVLGTINVNVKHVNENKRLSLIVGKGDGLSLLERDWLMLLILNWKAIYFTVREKLEDCLSVTLDNH